MPTRSGSTFSPAGSEASLANMSSDAPLTHSMLSQAMKDTMQPLLKEILQPMLNDILQPMLQGLEGKVTAKIKDIGREFRPAIQTLQATATEHTAGISALETSKAALEARMTDVEKSNAELLEKLISFEDRSRRNNIRVVGLPEGVEGSDPTKFIQSFLQKTFEQEFQSPPEIDRAHRTGPQPPTGGRPRPFLARIHFFRQKERVLQLSREAGQLKFNGKNIFIFPDLSAETSRRRAAFGPVKEILRTKRGVRYGIRHPARLWIEVDGQHKIFDSPVDAKNFCRDKFK